MSVAISWHALFSAHEGLERRPFGLELLLALEFFALSHLFEGVDPGGLLVILEFQLGESTLVIDGHRRPVVDGALDVVDADVVTKNRLSAAVARFDRRAGEANERRVCKCHALPNASFIGFTGTPIEPRTAALSAVFGDYISIYDIQRAVDDGATVPIYYESRLAKLELKDERAARLATPDFDEMTEGEEVEGKEQLKTKWAAAGGARRCRDTR